MQNAVIDSIDALLDNKNLIASLDTVSQEDAFDINDPDYDMRMASAIVTIAKKC